MFYTESLLGKCFIKKGSSLFASLACHLYLDSCARTSSIEVDSSANTIMFPPLVSWLYLLNALESLPMSAAAATFCVVAGISGASLVGVDAVGPKIHHQF